MANDDRFPDFISTAARNVLIKRYLHNNESWKDLCIRVARYIANSPCETHSQDAYECFYDFMYNLYLLPNSPCLKQAGISKASLSACFVLGPIEDNLDSIFGVLRDAAKVTSYGGGVGFNFSNLRPNGSAVSNRGISSGPIGFMKVYDLAIGDVIRQGGMRSSAMIALLDYRHDDIFDFIQVKDQENKILKNFNISVMVDFDFFKKCNTFGTRENKIFNEICFHAWLTGDPGMIFMERIRDKDLKVSPEINGVNPCLVGNSLLLDGDRLRRISEGVKGGSSWVSWNTGKKKVIKLICNNGFELKCTPDHKVMLEDGTFLEATKCLGKSLRWGLGNRYVDSISSDDVLEGFLFGDGYLSGNGHGVTVKLSKEREPDIVEFIESYGFHKQNTNCYYLNFETLKDMVGYSFDFLYNKIINRMFPDDVLFGNSNKVAGFLKGLFSANGSCNKLNGQISLKSTNKKMLQDVQILLASFGIPSWIVKNVPRKIKWPNGIYTSKCSYNLQIAPSNAVLFGDKIGFIHYNKMKNIRVTFKSYNRKMIVKEIVDCGVEDVWDFKMKAYANYNFCNGFVVHNCGELPLSYQESCNLASINLHAVYKHFKDNFWNKLKELVFNGIRFLDDMIDVNEFALDSIKEKTLSNRRVGLGIMGFADLLIEMGIPYDSYEAINFAEKLIYFINSKSYEESQKLGKERGNFPSFGFTKYPNFRNFMRNITCNTIAPTGSLSLIAGCSPGLEPNFFKEWVRKDETGTYNISHPLADRKAFCTALEIAPEWHVKMQATFQKYIDNGVSKTVNLPYEATVEDVKKIYLLANELGCKGITVFRDGCKTEQVISRKPIS